jgi:tetratricopeptide (TPR) repeat protein
VFPLDATATPLTWYQGYANFYLGDREKAFALFREAESQNPNHLQVLNDLATSYNLSGDPATAEKYYHKALSIQPGYGDALVNLAIIYYNQGKLEDSYKTLIHYKHPVKKESVQVFQTILTAKATQITSDSMQLAAFTNRLKKPPEIKKVLDEIRLQNGALNKVIR